MQSHDSSIPPALHVAAEAPARHAVVSPPSSATFPAAPASQSHSAFPHSPSNPRLMSTFQQQQQQQQFHFTPPLTPHSSREHMVDRNNNINNHCHPRPIFHNFLRAFYPFHPDGPVSDSTVTLPLEQGDLVLVHSVHTNGWADGTLLETGARGWLPTNYCEAYDQPPMQPTLKALSDFWDIIRNGSGDTLHLFSNQDYMKGLIAGVRFLLEKSECLTRDCELVRSIDGLRRNRKALLSDLSSLVKLAKRLQDVANGAAAVDEALDNILDQMLLKAFRIVTRGVRLLDVWTEEVGLSRALADTDPRSPGVTVPQHAAYSEPPTPPVDGAFSAAATPVQPFSPGCSSQLSFRTPISQQQQQQQQQPQSAGYATSSFAAPQPTQQQLTVNPNRGSVSHRISYNGSTSGPKNANLASERLGTSYDVFLGVLGAFIGLHLQSRSTSELLLTTQEAVETCRSLLAVVDQVWDHDMRRSELLRRAKNSMYDKITELVHATREIFQPANAAGDETIFLPDEGKRLVDAATECVRGAGECVAKARQVLEQIGDFETETSGGGLGIVATPASQPENTPSNNAANNDNNKSDMGRPGFEFKNGFERRRNNLSAKGPQLRSPPPPLQIPPNTTNATNNYNSNSNSNNNRSNKANIPISTPSQELFFTIPNNSSNNSSNNNNNNNTVSSPPPTSTTIVSTPTCMLDEPGSTTAACFGPLNDDGLEPLPEHHESTHVFPGPLIGKNGSSSFDSLPASAISSGSGATYATTPRDSETSTLSQTSTRATSPDVDVPQPLSPAKGAVPPTLVEEPEESEECLLEKTFAHELMFKDGQVVGGSLRALIEKLTAHQSTPDAMFVSTFFLTFRHFAAPTEVSAALIDRFDYVGDTPSVASPVRLRVYNIFKGWLESHWRHDCDDIALPSILKFARSKLIVTLPTAGKRLVDLVDRVSALHGPVVPRMVSSIGKTNTSTAQYVSPEVPLPNPVLSRSQTNLLKQWKNGQQSIGILDFDPLELARQFTIKASTIFCSILPEELLGTEWMKKSGSLAVNVRSMSTLSTDLTNLVADSILHLEEPKKRALVIKQWVKIAAKCLELNNYDTLMAIVCSLNTSTITRLKRTWELTSQKTKTLFEQLREVVDVSRNYAVLRQRLQNHVPPCLPFVGTYLTDLTFVDHGNQNTRSLPVAGDGLGGSGGGSGSMEVINFDKHMKTAKIISELQRFQIPYRLAEVPELQAWIQDQLVRVRSNGEMTFQAHYRRSLVLEPREQQQQQQSSFPRSTHAEPPSLFSRDHTKDKFDFLPWNHHSKSKPIPG